MLLLAAIVNQNRAVMRSHSEDAAKASGCDLGMVERESHDLKHNNLLTEDGARISKKVILPAAGFGRRVGSPPAKEMLPHPQTGRPLIGEVLNRLLPWGWAVHVVTRREKTELRDFLSRFPHVGVQTVNATLEWPDSVLSSKEAWADFNLLYLPDSEWTPVSLLPEMFLALEHHEVVFAGFKVQNPESWGVVRFESQGITIADKPREFDKIEWAWGSMAFRREVGRELFTRILLANQSGTWQKLSLSVARLEMESYVDLTREPLA